MNIFYRWVGTKGKDHPHPGIAPLADVKESEEVKYHKYYQWVCFFLFFEALMFYLPRYLWKAAEGGKIKLLVQGKIVFPSYNVFPVTIQNLAP